VCALLASSAFAEEDPDAEATEVSTSKPESASPGHPTFHLAGVGAFDAWSKQFGLELGATYSPLSFFDLGLGVSFGSSIGLLILAELHLPWHADSLFRAFGQVRGALHFQSGGYGGGLWAGASLELGPGRIKLGPALEVFAPRAGYFPVAVLVVGGYEFDLVRPATVEQVTERVVERPVTVEKTKSGATVLRGRLLDLDDKPINGTVRLRGRSYEASPDFEMEPEPGEYLVEAESPGYLVRGTRLKLRAGETTNHDFVLRPMPRVATAELSKTEVKIKQQLQFAFSKAEILPESFFILDEVADLLIRNAQIKAVRIEGHTDDVGGPALNQELSESRAIAVQNYLVERGVEPERLQAQGFGMSKPLAPNTTEAGRAKNRRVQFRIFQ
jgi:outer membrane protein OmpA-like peptidoglycan-associated protein